jgi:predicted amidohydrolase YtcJ
MGGQRGRLGGWRETVRLGEVFVNADVVTMDPALPSAQAFAAVGGRFTAIGSNQELRRWVDRERGVVDLGGRTVIPGLIESHSHPSLYALTLLQTDCRTPPNWTLSEVKGRVKAMAEALGAGRWVRGWGYDDTLISEGRHLTRTDLDDAAPANPVLVSHVSGHLAYANSLALAIAGIGAGTPQPPGGEIPRDERGLPTGLLKEHAAQELVLRHIPPYSTQAFKDALGQTIRLYNEAGITSSHDAAVGYFREGRQVLQAYGELEEEGRLDLRIYLNVVEGLYGDLPDRGPDTIFGSERLQLGCVKLFQDGSIQALTAALEEPYQNAPGWRGDIIHPQDVLDQLVEHYHRRGIQVAVHANGDRAIESALQALERAQRLQPRDDARHLIIHCQLASGDQISRMKRLGVIPSFFVNHVYYWGDRHATLFLGSERAARIDPLATAVKEGLVFTLHSDLPVTPVDPLFSMHCAVNRRTREGVVLGPQERISPLDALRAYTVHGAYCSFEENAKGSIEVGKAADFVVLSENPLTVPPERIQDIRVLRTVLGGRTVYEAGQEA